MSGRRQRAAAIVQSKCKARIASCFCRPLTKASVCLDMNAMRQVMENSRWDAGTKIGLTPVNRLLGTTLKISADHRLFPTRRLAMLLASLILAVPLFSAEDNAAL